MNPRNVYFLITVLLFVAANGGVAFYYVRRGRRLSHTSWDDLMAKLVSTHRDVVSLVAAEMVDEWGEPRDSKDSEGVESAELWTLLGGLAGLQVLEKNSEVLIELAFHLQQWYPEAIAVSERLRLDARELHFHVSRLQGAAQTGNLQVSFPFYARRAVVTYYLMTQRVLRLYEAGNFSAFSELQRAL